MPPKRKTPTIRDIAAKTGFSRSTVGAALQNRGDIAESTRKKIQAVAKKMGYRQDAEIQRLMSYLRQRKEQRESVSLVLLHRSKNNRTWLEAAWNKEFWRGVSQQAERLGFAIGLINVNEYVRNYERITSVLKARGIRGVILDGTLDIPTVEAIDLTDFACIRVGNHPRENRYHSTCPDYAYNLQLALDEAATLGYRRPLIALMDVHEAATDHLYHGTYLWWQKSHLPVKDRLAPLIYNYVEEQRAPKLISWIQSKGPDLLIGNDVTLKKKIEQAGIVIPEALGLIHLNLADDVAGWSGIKQGRDRIGEAAIDSIAAQFTRGDSGLPKHPRTLIIRGEWQHAATT